MQGIPNMQQLGPGAQNRYVPGGQQPQGGAAPAAPAAGAPQVGERKQFKQGWGTWNGTEWVRTP